MIFPFKRILTSFPICHQICVFFLGSTCADSGSGVGARLVRRLDNFWKDRVQVRRDTFIYNLLNIYFLFSIYC